MAKRREYDWIDDPFDEKKIAEEQERMHASGCSKLAMFLGIAAVVLVAAFAVFALWCIATLGSVI